MKNQSTKYLIVVAVLAAIVVGSPIRAQMPDDNVNSDIYENTAMGTGALYSNDAQKSPGQANVAIGYDALASNTTGSDNLAAGLSSLTDNTSGSDNVALGVNALYYNVSGSNNVATGTWALGLNTTGTHNVASGSQALYGNNGSQNTGIGADALLGSNNDASGNDNTAVGYTAQHSFTSGSYNTALGTGALYSNTAGNYNNAVGFNALYNNVGVQNSASGAQALLGNISGNYNTASGTNALYHNTSGSLNIADGYEAGFNLTSGSNNIDVGNKGNAGESGLIRIGTEGTHKGTYIAGIYNVPVSGGAAVFVNSMGQLGVAPSSERFKTDIKTMGDESERLGRLRPVTFHLKSDPQGLLQYGLIAEEVAQVYPNLVVRGTAGRIDGVRYDELTPVLLKQVQNEDARIRRLEDELAQLQRIAGERHPQRDLAAKE